MIDYDIIHITKGCGKMNRWTLHVEDFGKIKKADIEVTPFTLFIGDNNSGKSYLLSLIWGLMNLNVVTIFDALHGSNSENYIKSSEWLNAVYDKSFDEVEDGYRIKMDEEIFLSFNGLLNECLENIKSKITNSIFNRQVDIGKLSVELQKPYGYEVEIDKRFKINDSSQEIIVKFRDEVFGLHLRKEKKSDVDLGIAFIISILLNSKVADRITFLPASRTGFILTYKMLASKAILNYV